MGAADFWDKPDAARKTVAELKQLKAQVDPLTDLARGLEDATLAYQMSKGAGDRDLLAEADESLFQLTEKMGRVEQRSLLSGKHDHRNCFLTIAAGDGGTEANDWAEMLYRMYILYLERTGFEIEEVSKNYGTEVGIDSVTLLVVTHSRELAGQLGRIVEMRDGQLVEA